MSSEPIFQRSRELLKQVELELICTETVLNLVNVLYWQTYFCRKAIELSGYSLIRYACFRGGFFLLSRNSFFFQKCLLFFLKIYYPFLYFGFGLTKLSSNLLKKIIFWIFTIIILVFVEIILSSKLIILILNFRIQEFIKLINLSAPLGISVIAWFFDFPSFFTNYGVSQAEVNSVMKIIKKLDFKTKEELEALTKDIESFKTNADEQIKSYQWMIGAIWAIDVFYFNTGMADATRGIRNLSASNIFSNISVWLLIGYLLLSVYKRANDCIFQTIMYACNEYFSNDIHN